MIFDSFFLFKLIAKYGSLNQKRKQGEREREKLRGFLGILDKIGAIFCRTNDELLLCILFFPGSIGTL